VKGFFLSSNKSTHNNLNCRQFLVDKLYCTFARAAASSRGVPKHPVLITRTRSPCRCRQRTRRRSGSALFPEGAPRPPHLHRAREEPRVPCHVMWVLTYYPGSTRSWRASRRSWPPCTRRTPSATPATAGLHRTGLKVLLRNASSLFVEVVEVVYSFSCCFWIQAHIKLGSEIRIMKNWCVAVVVVLPSEEDSTVGGARGLRWRALRRSNWASQVCR
jgi:hypothetical protein